MAIAYQYDASGYYAGEVEDYGFLPNNATYKKHSVIKNGLWPRWSGSKWEQVEDHRERENTPELLAKFGEFYPQKATEYWLPEDTCDTPARIIKEYGPLPLGALLTQPTKCFSRVREEKYAEIISGADTVKAVLSSRFSKIEEETWPQQEAGARIILGLENDCKDETARVIMGDEIAAPRAVTLVEKLAEADGTDPQSFSVRIIENADTAYLAGMRTLLEQRALEAQLNAITYDETMSEEQKQTAINQAQSISVHYSVAG